MGLIVLILKS